MPCEHLIKVIEGIYSVGSKPLAIGWSCTRCRTSGATKWEAAYESERAEARLAELARDSRNEMTVR